MRSAFIEALTELAESDKRITLVVGDLGFGVVTDFARRFPSQFVNAGVSEQNMTGLAAGMALSGRIVFTYSIGNFSTLRCLEQIRNDVCYHKADVKIVAIGGGLAYGALGVSHYATEDIAVMRALPNMRVVAPGDPVEARLAVRAIAEEHGPAYLRLGRDKEPVVHHNLPGFFIGKAITVKPGGDITLIATGGMLYNTVKASEELSSMGIDARVLSMHTIEPLDREAVLSAAKETSAIFTVEEHSTVGGLGSAVADVLAEAGCVPERFVKLGLPPKFPDVVGDQEFLKSRYRLDVAGIVGRVLETLGIQSNAAVESAGTQITSS